MVMVPRLDTNICTSSKENGFALVLLDRSIYVAGSTNGDLDGQSNSGDRDAFLIEYDGDGSKLWTQLLGSSYQDFARSVSAGADGSVYIAGFTDGPVLDGQSHSGWGDAFISKYSVIDYI